MRRSADGVIQALRRVLSAWDHTHHAHFHRWAASTPDGEWVVTALDYADHVSVTDPLTGDSSDGSVILRHVPPARLAGVLAALGAPVPKGRTAHIGDARALLDWLDETPSAPTCLTKMHVSILADNDESGIAAVHELAETIGQSVTRTEHGHYRVTVEHGTASYHIVYIEQTRIREYQAEMTYFGAVTPDEVSP